ncbi:MAG: hypothetical protein ABJF10_10780 [Chthoniobacter sp.]|uniref:hypothetical protein n=1 Tax=Chthoniobacter sp. TaxID=2510640 RepID=UPI0032A59498
MPLSNSVVARGNSEQTEQCAEGDFADTSAKVVSRNVGFAERCTLRNGLLLETFKVFAHIDLDIYRSILDCVAFIGLRLLDRGVVVVDDYGVPLWLPMGRAVVYKNVNPEPTL